MNENPRHCIAEMYGMSVYIRLFTAQTHIKISGVPLEWGGGGADIGGFSLSEIVFLYLRFRLNLQPGHPVVYECIDTENHPLNSRFSSPVSSRFLRFKNTSAGF